MDRNQLKGNRIFLALDDDASIYGFVGDRHAPEDNRLLVHPGTKRTEDGVEFTVVTLENAQFELRDGWVCIAYDDGRYCQEVVIPAQHVRALRQYDFYF